jgi:hypothetical protein
MKVRRYVTALFAGMVAASACAQSAPQPLNLKLPPGSVPPESASAAAAHSNNENSPAAAPTPTEATDAPINAGQMPLGVQYDDPNGLPPYAEAPAARKCDDATYRQPQLHGSATVGVVAGNHVSGNYQGGVVNMYKAFGSCDNPTGGVGISIGVGQENFNGRHHGWP